MLSQIFNNAANKKYFYFAILLGLSIFFFIKNPDVAFMLFASILFACSLSPLVDKLSKKMSRTMATTVILTALFVLICIFILPILYLSGYEIFEFAKAFPGYIDSLDKLAKNLPLLKTFNINIDTITNIFSDSSSAIFGCITDFIASISSTFIYIFTTVIFLFFFLTDKELIKNNILKLFPSNMREKTSTMLDNMAEKLGGYVVAQVIVSGSVWITMTIGLLAFNIDYALVLGLIAGILSLIPVVGSAISLVICLIATFQSGWVTLVIVTLLFTVSHFIENHIARPWVYSKFLNLHPVLIFLALFVGAKYYGIVGVIFAPPLVMVLCLLLEEIYSKKMD